MTENSKRIDEDKGNAGKLPMSEPSFPNLTAMRAHDRQMHIERALEMGMTREEAEKHAQEDLGERDDDGVR